MAEDTFENATVVAQANIYYDGDVTSREVRTADGERKTLGIMLPGEYTFGTDAAETIEVYAGEATVTLSGEEPVEYAAGDTFSVPANTEFDIEVTETVDYCCTYDE